MSLKILQNKKIQELIVFGIMPPLTGVNGRVIIDHSYFSSSSGLSVELFVMAGQCIPERMA